jgi:hypothetical protein
MPREAAHIDISTMPEVARLAEIVAQSGRPHLLHRGDTVVAEIRPPRASRNAGPRRRRTPSLPEGDALLGMIGLGATEQPTDIAHRKREYLAEAYAPEHA